MKLVVFIPAYLEEKTIGSTVRDVRSVLASPEITKDFTETEVIVLNNTNKGVFDNTVAIAEKEGAVVYHIQGESKGVGWVMKKLYK